ncbi:hypothetical protein [Flavobacterium sp. YJ01]|uniref:hypothetical protein n=1 Tax=unclassified Flavobacterium TaxID=196869 RepID=UPI0023E4222E|nr:hypothetical protein [Flavobacterium sp. YJ01]WET03495.1 hypothetical protein P0R33_03970 [Flavobacterium sp. YJ01]
MEKIKLSLDIGITFFGVLAALFAVLSLIYGSKIDAVKKIEEERLKSKIAESNASAQKAKEEAANALVSAANTNERAKKLELKVEEQKEKTANAEKELIILKDKIKPRSIPTQNVNKLIAELKKLSNKEIHISSSLGDGEGATYATQFKNLFEFAGWKVNSGIGFSTYTGVGVYLLTKNKNDTEAIKIKKIFNASDIHFQEQIMEEGTKLQIFIGSKNSQDLDSN